MKLIIELKSGEIHQFDYNDVMFKIESTGATVRQGKCEQFFAIGTIVKATLTRI